MTNSTALILFYLADCLLLLFNNLQSYSVSVQNKAKLGLWRWAFTVCSFLRPSLFHWIELFLWQWGFNVCSFLRPSFFGVFSCYRNITDSQIYCSFFIVLCSCGLLYSIVIYCFRNFVNRYTRKLPFLPSNCVRLVMMGIHCLFILTTLSLPSGWVRLQVWPCKK